jgi:hypothetical protein
MRGRAHLLQHHKRVYVSSRASLLHHHSLCVPSRAHLLQHHKRVCVPSRASLLHHHSLCVSSRAHLLQHHKRVYVPSWPHAPCSSGLILHQVQDLNATAVVLPCSRAPDTWPAAATVNIAAASIQELEGHSRLSQLLHTTAPHIASLRNVADMPCQAAPGQTIPGLKHLVHIVQHKLVLILQHKLVHIVQHKLVHIE